ncbi:MAG TPA: amidohydrolase family protein [Gemmatimonadaceae bacterium]|nr:amidohydrolase family protein [Gemmatimonadaceae bacterium]
MLVDCHVHVNAFQPANGRTSHTLLGRPSFRYLRWRLGMKGADEATERALVASLAAELAGATEVDAAVILAFDAVYGDDGRLDEARTHLHVENDYVIELTRREPKMLFGASVHPYRRDAVAELERCAKAGAVLLKWLPITQGMNPADRRCFPLYEALAHFGIPLLAHTGGEKTLPNIDTTVADPALLRPALERGVTVIAAHCGTRSAPGETCFVKTFVRMAKEHERFYGDTSALNLPTRAYAYDSILDDAEVRAKLVHGSDWPIPPVPMPRHHGWRGAASLLRDRNMIRRDVAIKRALGLTEPEYWARAASLLRVPATRPA